MRLATHRLPGLLLTDHERYPGDRDRLDRVADRLSRGDVRVPSGGPCPVQRLQQAGIRLGRTDGFAHDGLRSDARVLDRVFALVEHEV